MNRFIRSLAFFTLVCIFFTTSVKAESSGISKIDDSIDVLKAIVSVPEKSIPPALLHNAAGIAIIPGVIKAGFILGGRYGNGILIVRDKEGGWSNPAFMTLTGGSIGRQIGIQSIDIILVFKHRRSIEGITKGKFTLGADASIAAGPVGREAEAATDVQLKSEIYSYSRTRGLFAGLALEGAVLQIDDEANEKFYKKEYIKTGDIFANKGLKTPPDVEKLKKLLSEHAK